MNIHILDDWADTLRSLPCFQRLQEHAGTTGTAGTTVTVWTDHAPDNDTLAERLADAEVLVLFRERTTITRALLERLPRLRMISQISVYPHVDVPACTDHGVLLCSNMHNDTPSYAAAELTWALILSGMRQLPQQMHAVKSGQWQAGVGKTLKGRTLGLYGYGRLGKVVASYAKAFGMHVVWWGSDAGRGRAAADGETIAASRHAFFALPDVVSLHLRLNATTRGIITADDLRAMRPDALLVNTARAGLIASGALLAALNGGLHAAIDVFDQEPLRDPNDPVLSHAHLIATPHIGFVTEDEFEIHFSTIFDQVVAYAAGAPINMINPEALPTDLGN